MMSFRQHTSIPRGFTLVEVLIAILIFGIIVTTLFASHRSVFVSAPIVESNISIYEMAGTCLGRMALDLRSIYITQAPVFKKPEFDAAPDPHRVLASNDGGDDTPRLQFASLAHLHLEQSRREGVAQIFYYVTPVDDEIFQVRRADRLYPYPRFAANDRDPVLCEWVKRLDIRFVDQEGNDFDYWNSDSDEFDYATPTAVDFTIELVQGGTTSFFETRVSLPVKREPLE